MTFKCQFLVFQAICFSMFILFFTTVVLILRMENTCMSILFNWGEVHPYESKWVRVTMLSYKISLKRFIDFFFFVLDVLFTMISQAFPVKFLMELHQMLQCKI